MGLTSALNTSLNGLTLNETTIDVLGNNIANAGTNGFKASTALFTTQLSRTLSVGSRPTETNGGTNPRQVGLGATTSAIVKDFSQGGITNSTSPSDLAIQGDGLFVLDGPAGQVYSRNGNFSLNSTSLLVNAQGNRVQGYGVDENFDLVTTTLTDLRIPLGELNIAERTQNITISGALLPTGTVANRGAALLGGALTDTTTKAPATASSKLSDVTDGTNNLFTVGETLSFTGRKGGRTVDAETLVVQAATTVGDLAALIGNTLGIHDEAGVPPNANGNTPGVTVTTAGQLQIFGNAGTVNDLSVAVGDLTSNGAAVPLGFSKQADADGESAVTDFIVYDSLGQQVDVKMSAVLESVTPTTTTYRWLIDSSGDSRSDVAIATGTITFDSVGHVINGGIGNFALERNDTAAISPMQITVDFRNISGISSAAAGSKLSLGSQDGSSPGNLVNYVIDESGNINGVFDNGIIRSLGQAVLARFNNAQGLVESGNGTYSEGVSSGPPFLTTPGSFGAGSIRSGAIELSNTDIGRNLVDLIVASTNYRGNARVISSVQQLVDELLVLGR